MSAYSILVGLKGLEKTDERAVIAIGAPQEINASFKAAVLAGSDEYKVLEVVSSRDGRTKRKRLCSVSEAEARAAAADKARQAREAAEKEAATAEKEVETKAESSAPAPRKVARKR